MLEWQPSYMTILINLKLKNEEDGFPIGFDTLTTGRSGRRENLFSFQIKWRNVIAMLDLSVFQPFALNIKCIENNLRNAWFGAIYFFDAVDFGQKLRYANGELFNILSLCVACIQD